MGLKFVACVSWAKQKRENVMEIFTLLFTLLYIFDSESLFGDVTYNSNSEYLFFFFNYNNSDYSYLPFSFLFFFDK